MYTLEMSKSLGNDKKKPRNAAAFISSAMLKVSYTNTRTQLLKKSDCRAWIFIDLITRDSYKCFSCINHYTAWQAPHQLF